MIRRTTILPNRQRRGAALVEAALILPIFFVAIVGIVEFGRGMMVTQLVTNTAREAVRQAILEGSTNSDVTTFAKESLAGAASAATSDVTVTITIAPGSGSAVSGNQLSTAEVDDIVTVEIGIPYDSVSFISGNYLDGKILSAKGTMRHE